MSFSLVFDVEANGLQPTKIHCLAVHCLELDETWIFADHPGYSPISEGLVLLEEADWIIAHNGRNYDIPNLERLYPKFSIKDKTKLLDTLLLAREYFPEFSTHKLEDWGIRLGLPKGSFGKTADWKYFSHEMCQYCIQDVAVTTLLHEVIMAAALEQVAKE